MTLQNLAQLVGTTAQTIQRLETNNMTVSLDWLERIADAFGVPVTELLVDSRSQKISLLGEIDATGELRPSPGATSGYDLSLAIPAEFPVAARVSSDLGGFVAGQGHPLRCTSSPRTPPRFVGAPRGCPRRATNAGLPGCFHSL